MNEAGWFSIGQGVYVHKHTGKSFDAWTWEQMTLVDGVEVDNGSEKWRVWAAVRQTPPPF